MFISFIYICGEVTHCFTILSAYEVRVIVYNASNYFAMRVTHCFAIRSAYFVRVTYYEDI